MGNSSQSVQSVPLREKTKSQFDELGEFLIWNALVLVSYGMIMFAPPRELSCGAGFLVMSVLSFIALNSFGIWAWDEKGLFDLRLTTVFPAIGFLIARVFVTNSYIAFCAGQAVFLFAYFTLLMFKCEKINLAADLSTTFMILAAAIVGLLLAASGAKEIMIFALILPVLFSPILANRFATRTWKIGLILLVEAACFYLFAL